jgi:hypothetical protein
MSFHLLRPEVAGGWGPNIQAHRQTHPPVVTHLHYEFEGWLGDDLLTTFPEFIVTERLARALEQSGLTGFGLASMETSHDFGRTSLAELVVSQKGLDLLRRFSLKQCEVRPWGG